MSFGQIVVLLLAVVAAQTLGDFQVAARSSQLARDGASRSCEFGTCAPHVTFEACPTVEDGSRLNLRACQLQMVTNQETGQRQKALESTLQNAVFDDKGQKNRVHMEHYEAAVHPGTSELAQICGPPSCPMVREAGNNVDQWSGFGHFGVKLAGSDKYDGHLAAEPELFYASLSDYGTHPEGQSSLMDDLHPHKDRPMSYIQNWGIPAIFCGMIFILILLRAVLQGLLSDLLSITDRQNSINQKEQSFSRISSLLIAILAFSSILGIFEVHSQVTYHIRATTSTSYNVCTSAQNCRNLDNITHVYLNLSKASIDPFTVLIYDSPVLNASFKLDALTRTRTFMKTNVAPIPQYHPSILFAYNGEVVAINGTFRFQQIDFKLQSGISDFPYCISAIGANGKIIFTDCRTSMETPGTISSRGFLEVNTSGSAEFAFAIGTPTQYYRTQVVALERSPLMKLGSDIGNVLINSAVFENITRNNGDGGVIYAELGITTSAKLIMNDCSFQQCSVNTTNNNRGGAVYIKGIYSYKGWYSFTNVNYTDCDARYGKGIFIETDNLIEFVNKSSSVGLIQVGSYPDSLDERYMMGYVDSTNNYMYPVLYIWEARKEGIFHVTNAPTTYTYGLGVDNIICGRVRYPCVTIDYAISQSKAEDSNRKTIKLGIITGYKLSQTVTNQVGITKISILNSLNLETEQSDDSLANLTINSNVQFFIEAGDIEFRRINFTLLGSTNLHLIQTGTAVSNVEILGCNVCLNSSIQTTQYGLVSMAGGTLTVTGLDFKNIRLVSRNIIQVKSGYGNLNLANCNIDSVSGSLTASQNYKASVFEAVCPSSSRNLSIDNCTIKNVILTASGTTANISPLDLTIGSGSVALMNNVTIADCKGKDGGALSVSIATNGKFNIIQGCKFTNLQADNNGGAIWINMIEKATFTVTAAAFDNCNSTQLGGCIYIKTGATSDVVVDLSTTINGCEAKGGQGGAIYADMTSGGTFYFNNSNVVTNCKTSGGSDKFGGAIYANIGGDGKLLISTYCEFTNCNCASGSGGAIYASLTGSSSTFEIKDNVKIENCSCGRDGGAICIPNTQTGQTISLNKVDIKDCSAATGGGLWTKINAGAIVSITNYSTFTNCSSSSTTSLGGGGLYSVISGTGSQLTISNNVEFQQCTSKYHGGGAYIDAQTNLDLDIIGNLFGECKAEKQGGGLYIKANLASSNKLELSNTFFRLCESKTEGGGLYSEISSTDGKFIISNNSEFVSCTSTTKGGGAFISSTSYKQIDLSSTIFSNSISQLGGGLYIDINNGVYLNITNAGSFTNCSTTSATGQGAGLYAKIGNTNNFTISNSVLFNNCSSDSSGGGAYIEMHDKGQLLIDRVIFDTCKSGIGGGIRFLISHTVELVISTYSYFGACNATQNGAGVYIVTSNAANKVHIKDNVKFDICYCSGGSGGGAYIDAKNSQSVTLDQVLFSQCNAITSGGGLFLEIGENTTSEIINYCSFANCLITDGIGGGIYASINGPRSSIQISDSILFDTCTSSAEGGALYFKYNNPGTITLDRVSFKDCIGSSGGAIYAKVNISGSKLSILNQTTFGQCNSTVGSGGAIYTEVKGTGSELQISHSINIDNCITPETADGGGAMYLKVQDNGSAVLNSVTINKCSSKEGGGIWVQIEAGCSFKMTNRSSIRGSSVITTGNGGNIHAVITGANAKFELSNDIHIDDCNISSGLGGGGYFLVQNGASVNMSNVIFSNSYSTLGGGIHALIESGSTFTIADSSQIRNCSSIRTTGNTGDGGGIYAIVGENCQFIFSNTVHIEDCKSDRQGGGAYIRNIAGNGRVELNQINVKLCNGTEGGGIYTQIERQSNFTITGTSVFENCHSTEGNGGALYASVIGQNSKLIIKDDVQFDTCDVGVTPSIGGGAYFDVSQQGSVELSTVTFKECKAEDGGAIYAKISNATNFTIVGQSLFTKCNATKTVIENTSIAGRGGAIYLNLIDNSTYNYLFGSDLQFQVNNATGFGRDLFITCPTLQEYDFIRYIQFNVSIDVYNKTNALYGTEYWTIAELYRVPLFDYDLLTQFDAYQNDILIITGDPRYGFDGAACGTNQNPCKSFHYSLQRVKTPQWTADSAKKRTDFGNKVDYDFRIMSTITINQPLITEAEILTLQPISQEEADYLQKEYGYTAKFPVELHFSESGQVVLSDLAIWQTAQGDGHSDQPGFDQVVNLKNLEIYLPQQIDVDTAFSIIGSQDDGKTVRRDATLRLEDCTLKQETIVLPAEGGSCALIKSEPYLSNRTRIQLINLQTDQTGTADYIVLLNQSLIELSYEPNAIDMNDDYFYTEQCTFTKVKCIYSSWALKESPLEDSNNVPLGAGTVITFRAQTAQFLPIHVSDCTFDKCIFELRIRPNETRQIGVGGAVGAFGKNLRVGFEYFRFINCTSSVQFLSASSQSDNSENGDQYQNILHSSSNEIIFEKESQASSSNEITKPAYQVDCAGGVIISTAGNRGIGRFEAKEKLAQYFKNLRQQSFDASVLVDELIQPYFKLDVCVFKQCNSIVNQLGNPIKVLESGGAIVHLDKVGARCEFKSDIFDDCRTTATSVSGAPSATNIANSGSPFEPI